MLTILVVVLVGALGYVTLTKRSVSTEQSQLTKESVSNGFDQCGVQFKEGILSVGWDKYQQLAQTCDAAVAGADFFSEITFVDLDSDGIMEALVSGRVVRASSGGILYVFKNENGVARVVDSVSFGKENGEVVSINGNTVVVQTDGAMQSSSKRLTYKFVNGKLIKQ